MRATTVLLLCAACSSGDEPAAVAPDLSPLGGERSVEIIAPAGFEGGAPIPLVIFLHGFGASGVANDLVLGLAGEVDARGFLLLRPDGTIDADGRRFWNATDACCDKFETGVDDVGYIAGLIEEARGRFDISRVGLIGHSNGGYMAHRFACDRASAVDAFASLAGSTWQDASRCEPDDTVMALQIHGTEDDSVPIEGRPPEGDYPGHPSAQETVGRWAALNGCASTASDGGAADFSLDVEGAETAMSLHDGCDEGGGAELWVMQGEGHLPAVNDAWRGAVLDHLTGEP